MNAPVWWHSNSGKGTHAYIYIYIRDKKVLTIFFDTARTLGQREMILISWMLSSRLTKVIVFISLFFFFVIFCSSSLPGFCQSAIMPQPSPSFFPYFILSIRKRRATKKATHTYMHVLSMKHVILSYVGRQLGGESTH